jgi:hypothetical protein
VEGVLGVVGLDGTACCSMIGPVSTPASTRWQVVPVTLTP